MYTNECNLTYLKELTNSLVDRDIELKKHNELIKLVFDNCPSSLIIWAVDKNLVFTLSEGRGLKNLGFKSGENIGKSLYEYFDTVDDEFMPIKYHIKALEGMDVKFDYEHNGRIWHTHCTPILSKENKIIGVIGCAFDITKYVDQQNKILELEKIIKDSETRSKDKMKLLEKLIQND